jgi:hypothetical protein
MKKPAVRRIMKTKMMAKRTATGREMRIMGHVRDRVRNFC